LLVNTNPEREHPIYNQLVDESKIIELGPLYREYDLIAKVKIGSKEKPSHHFILFQKELN
jgi:hypothetical protein